MKNKTNKQRTLIEKLGNQKRRDEMYFARGEIKTLDLFFDSLTREQQTNIIKDETLDIGNWKVSDWWKGMTKTEKTEALLSLIKLNLNL